MHNKAESEMVTKVQSTIRGFISRKKYKINQLPPENLEDYSVLILGNDPNDLKVPNHGTHESVALIGTSGFRAVEIAYMLNKGSTKLIILDNSKKVTDFWRKARSIISATNSVDDFLTQLKAYVQSSQCNRANLTDREFGFLKGGYKQFDFEAVKRIILNATIIGQSWGDKRIFTTIKNVLEHLNVTNVYAYVSNIVAYVNSYNNQDAQQILQNIEILNPKIAIHSDSDNSPKNFFLITDHRPSEVQKQLMGQNQTDPCTPLLEDENYDQILTRSLRKKTNEVKDSPFFIKIGFFNKEDEIESLNQLTNETQLKLEKDRANVLLCKK